MNFQDVFVYGTLRKRGTNHHIISQSPCIDSQLTIYGYSLYDFQHSYPYMVEGPDTDFVIGEVYRVDRNTLNQLDILEDVKNNLYKLIYLPKYHCYTYIKNDQNVKRLPKIEDGDWIGYIKSLELE